MMLMLMTGMKKGSKGGSRKNASGGGSGLNGKESTSSSAGAACVSPQTVVAIARELQLAELGPDVATFIAQSTEYQLREIIEDAIKVT